MAARPRLLLRAQAEDGEQAVPQATHEAAGADGEQDDHTGNDADDDAGNGTSAQAGPARRHGRPVGVARGALHEC